MRYENFVIQMTAGADDSLVLQVTESPVGESPAVVCGAASELLSLLEESQAALSDHDVLADWDHPETVGRRLFDALFSGAIHQRFLEALGRLGRGEDRGLRLQIRASIESPIVAEANALPWEYLYRSDNGSFLALDRRFALVRNLCLAIPHRRSPDTGKLRLLIAIASPAELDPLETEEECRSIGSLWEGSGLLKVDLLAHTTLERLREQLLVHHYHGLHLIGHGCFDDLTGDGEILLEDSEGSEAPCAGRDLAIQLADRTSLRWVFLNACSTGCSNALRPFGGLATALLRTGVSAVVAMQRPVTDRSAIIFSSWFYRRLAAGDPIETAVTEGRLAVHRDGPEDSEWGIPLLFLRAPDGHLFNHLPAPEESTTARQITPAPPRVCRPETDFNPQPDLGGRSKMPLVLLLLFIIAGLVGLTGLPGDLSSTTPTGQQSETVLIRHGETVGLSSLTASLTATFDERFGTPFVRVTVAVDGRSDQIDKTLMGPTTLDLGSKGRLRIQTIDWQQRQITAIAEP